jgi:ribose 5-phosphate isomerase RpiB
VRTWLNAHFSGAERHVRRLRKIAAFEQEFGSPLSGHGEK